MTLSTRLIVDPELMILEAGSGSRLLCGHAVEQLPGMALDDLLSPRDRLGLARFYADLSSHAGGWIDMLVSVSPGPERSEVGACPARLRLTGHEAGWLAVLEDLEHEGNTLIRTLSLEAEQWRSVVRGSVDGMAFLDRLGRTLMINDRLLELLPLTSLHGVALNEAGLLGRELMAMLPPPFAPVVEAAQAAKPHERQITLSVAYGERELEVHLTPTIAPGQGYLGAGLVVRDVTAEREVEVLRLAHARSAGMAELATSVLHNIGNATNSVQVGVDTLTQELTALEPAPLLRIRDLLASQQESEGFLATPKGAQLVQYLDVLHRRCRGAYETLERELGDLRDQTKHIVEIIGAQQERAKTSTVVELVELTGLIETSIKMSLLGSSGVRVDASTEVVWVETDRHRVIQIVVNLLTNARNALLEAQVTEPCIAITVREVGQQVTVEVRDNGCGVPSDLHQAIFQHGFTTRLGGHGFGLHNACLLATELGGSLRLDPPAPETGAVFRLCLPRRNAVVATQPTSGRADTPPRGRGRPGR